MRNFTEMEKRIRFLTAITEGMLSSVDLDEIIYVILSGSTSCIRGDPAPCWTGASAPRRSYCTFCWSFTSKCELIFGRLLVFATPRPIYLYPVGQAGGAARAASKRKGGFVMGKTQDNLKAAFAGESQANRKYLAFADQAEKEGHPQVARLFRAAAEAETIHAHNHLRALGMIKSTKENLEAAIAGETFEFKDMYPGMINEAKSANDKNAERTFIFANEVEKAHAALYSKALDGLGKNEEVDYYLCPFCGYTAEKEPPDKCPVCGAKKEAFFKVG